MTIAESGYSMFPKIAIFGCGWHGRTVLANYHAHDALHRCVFIDDNATGSDEVDGIPVLHSDILGNAEFVAQRQFIVCIGDTSARYGAVDRVRVVGGKFCSSFHPSVVFCHNIEIGEGTAIMPGAVVGTGVRVGKHCVVNNLVSLGHATIVKDGASVNDGSHTCGGVVIGQEAHIGIGVSILNNVRIGDRAIVGLGAVVIEDVPSDVTVAGVPARIIKTRGTRG